LYALLSSPMPATCPTHLIHFALITPPTFVTLHSADHYSHDHPTIKCNRICTMGAPTPELDSSPLPRRAEARKVNTDHSKRHQTNSNKLFVIHKLIKFLKCGSLYYKLMHNIQYWSL
jgi:hypothetical protein